MQVARFLAPTDPNPRAGLVQGRDVVTLVGLSKLSDLLHAPDPIALATQSAQGPTFALADVTLLAPIDDQEVWGAGVTYERSKVAREEESERAATFYDDVYKADRPELFFKATPNRVVATGPAVRVRADSKWSVPEPELGLVLDPSLRLVGYTIGNDMSARDIEGRNPLYLPQAKMYDACCALGPVVELATAENASRAWPITLQIERGGRKVFQGETSTARMARDFASLIAWLGRENVFPSGVVLLTGTGIVPPDDFSLQADDLVRIAVEGIGELVNTVVKRT